MNIRILIADDHNMMREGLVRLIAEQPDMTVIAEAEDGLSAVQLAAKFSPDIIIMDIKMPGLDGIEATSRILSANRSSKVIALSMYQNRSMVLNMLNAGVSGFLLKDCAFDELIHAIGTVETNRTYLSSKIIDTVVEEYKRQLSQNEVPMLSELTFFEHDFLRLLAEGKKTNQIAAMFQISITDAEFIRQKIILKYIAPGLKRSFNQVFDCDVRGNRPLYLTAREKEILLLIKDGHSTSDMSLKVGISQDTIKFHVKNIYQKFNANNRTQAVMIAIENNLLDL